MKPSEPSQRGYSLTEMLVVVAIIGILSLVTVPNFMSMYQSSKMKTSLNQFTNDVRAVRQRAVTTVSPVKLSWQQGATAREYRVYTGVVNAGAVTWTEVMLPTWKSTPVNRRMLDEIVYFSAPAADAFTDQDSPADGWLDIIFLPSGQLQFPAGSTASAAKLVLKTDRNISKQAYTITVNNTGRVFAE